MTEPKTHTDLIENVLYQDIAVGDSARLVRTLTLDDIRAFAAVSGDINPAHLDAAFANESMFHGIIGHGMWSGSLVSTVLGTQFPGPGTIYLEQSFRFKRPVHIGDTLTVSVTVVEKQDDKHSLLLDCVITNQHNETVVVGQARVMAPTEKVIRPKMGVPKLNLFDPESRVKLFVSGIQPSPPVMAACVHPTSEASLLSALKMKETGAVDPVLIGPMTVIEPLAQSIGIDLSQFTCQDASHSHHSAELAAQWVREGKVELLCRGNLEKNELLDVIRSDTTLLTKRRLSHVFRFEVPLYQKPLWLTDAVLNHRPQLEDKVDMVQNAIDLARLMGVEDPRVALISAVNRIDPEYPSTLDAAALCKMADRKQIQGGRLDGPMAFDEAVSEHGNIAVHGPADILVAPDNESANMLAKQLEYFAGASSCGVVLGARVPIALSMQSASAESQMLSALLGAKIAEHYRTHTP